MLASKQIMPPEHWQDFEILCKKLWGEIWNCPDTIKRNGRAGQTQCGVDVYAAPNGGVEYYGIQCKGKDNYTRAQLTTKEIDDEIEKAKGFIPKLKSFYFATTAVKDAKIEEYIRIKNQESQQNGGFAIDVFSWEDIKDLLLERKSVYNWYINNYQYLDNTNVELQIKGGDEFTLQPEYFRTTITYKVKETSKNSLDVAYPQILNNPPIISFNDILNPKCKIDYRWCDITLRILNTGSTTIEDYNLELIIHGIQTLSDKFSYYNPSPLLSNSPQVAQINAERVAKRELYKSTEYSNVITLRPKNTILVETDQKIFKIGVKPEDDAKEVTIQWKLRSRGYSKDGILKISVEPKYTGETEVIEVDCPEDLRNEEVKITPKIIEE